MIKKNWKTILKIVFYCMVSFFLVRVCKEWTAIPRTNPNLAKAIYVFVGLWIGILVLDIFKNKIVTYLKNGLIILNIAVIVVTHSWLSYWYLDIQSQEWQVMYYSSCFEPHGDLAMLQVLLEEKTLIVAEDEANYTTLWDKLGSKTVYTPMDTEDIIEKYTFEDAGHLRSLYLMYSAVFDLEYTGQTEFPHLYVATNLSADKKQRYVFSDENKNIYIFESDDIDYDKENIK